MNVSDRRGKPVSRYAIEPVARLALRRASAIGPLEHPAESLGAAPELETSLDVRPPLPPEPLPPVRPAGEQPERAGDPPGTSGRKRCVSTPCGRTRDGAPARASSAAMSRLQAMTQAARRARAASAAGVTFRASRAWTLKPYGTPSRRAACAATAAGRCAK